MIYPPVFDTVKSAAVVALLKAPGGDLRVYPYGYAKQPIALPYVVWQTISGSPENYINQRPDADNWLVQVDIYGDSSKSVREVAEALRDSLEWPTSSITGWNGESRDPTTMHWRFGFDCEFWTRR